MNGTTTAVCPAQRSPKILNGLQRMNMIRRRAELYLERILCTSTSCRAATLVTPITRKVVPSTDGYYWESNCWLSSSFPLSRFIGTTKQDLSSSSLGIDRQKSSQSLREEADRLAKEVEIAQTELHGVRKAATERAEEERAAANSEAKAIEDR